MARSGPVLLVGTRKGIFVVSGDDSRDLATPIVGSDELTIVQALSGG